ncbi:MAG: biotin--[acetyl-CoA-carboxylase] ligase [Deltaproteobacteria bacterium]|nr:biotin--[acetyl-CoA-carboxylase] ligase [Deltaproteobacteria bacterium]
MSPALVQQAVGDGKLWRAASFPARAVTDILRYGAPVGSRIIYSPAAQRCMDIARQQIVAAESAGRSFASGTVFVAGELSGGKGRFRRSWYAPAGGLWLVTVLVNTLLPESAALYSLAAGVACCETVRHYGIAARIKWVNDILAGGRKLAGILVESMRGPRYGEEYILLGIGLNVNNCDFPPELTNQAGSMAQFMGGPLDLRQVGARLLADLAWNIGLLHFVEAKQLAGLGPVAGSMHPLLKSWRHLSDTLGRRVRFGFNAIANPQFAAQALDIDQTGALVMRLDDGSTITENSGEIVYE